MKKYFLSIVALAGMLFATSCQESLVEPQMEGPTTFTVQLPDQMGTKADIGSKANVNQLFVAVYADDLATNPTPIYRTVASVSNGQATVSLNLIQGQLYDVIFWAQVGDNYVSSKQDANDNFTFDLVNIPMNKNYHNTDAGAAFFYYWNNFKPTGTSQPVTLRRPFAQLNLGTTYGSLTNNAGTFTLQSSVIKVKGIADNFNTVSGFGTVTEANKDIEYTFDAVALPSDDKINVAGVDYKYVSMDYLPIVGDDQALITVDATITLSNDQSINHKFTNVPVRENYRTNIVGNLISSSSEFTVKVDDSWAGADYNEEYVAPGIRLVNGEYEITSEEGLWSLAEIVNGGTKALTASDFSGKTIKLTCDIDLENEPWTPIGGVGLVHFSGVFDGNDHKISNLLVMPASDDDNSYKGLFGAARGIIKNLTLENVNVKGHSKVGALVGDGQNAKIEKCKVVGGSVTSTPANGLKGNNVGGLVGYLYADGKSETYAFVNSCSVENLTVKAYSDVAGLVGTVGCTSGSKEATVVGNTIKNVVVIADQSVLHNETRKSNAGEVYGRKAGDGKITISDNTTEEVIVSVIEKDVDIAEQIENAQEGAVVAIPAGEYTTLPTPDNKITIVCVEGTVFEGTSSLNIKGSTVIGATFENETGKAVTGTINGTFKNCYFKGKDALKDCDVDADEPIIFENCTFEGDDYTFHFDDGSENSRIICVNCIFNSDWRVAIGAGISLFEAIDCEFNVRGFINFWGNVNLENCEFTRKPEYWIRNLDKGTYTDCLYLGRPLDVEDITIDEFIIINNEYYVSGSEALKSVMNEGVTKIHLTNAEDYDLNGIQKDGLTLIGVGEHVKVANTTNFAGGGTLGAITKAINLENVTITNTVYTMDGGSNATFKNVYFEKGVRQAYGNNVKFEGCRFGSNSDGYALHFQTDANSNGKITIDGCQFNGGKVHLGGKRTYDFKECNFEVGTDFQVWSNITIENCSVDGIKVTLENIAGFFPNLNLEKVTIR